MVTWLLLSALAAAPAPVAVLQQGSLLVEGASTSSVVGPASVLRAGARISTDGNRWAEVSMLGGVRSRLSAGTALRLPAPGTPLQVSEGRVWIQRDARESGDLEVVLPGLRVWVAPRSSVVLEHTRSAGTLLVVRAGHLDVDTEGVRHRIVRGQAARRASGVRALPAPRAGGAALAGLVSDEARTALGDPSDLLGFLLASTGHHLPRPRGGLELEDLPRSPAAVNITDSGDVGALVEAGLRPPPFFEEEVPTKGPNLDVQVRFP